VRALRREGLVRRAGAGWILATDEIDHVTDVPVIEWMVERELRRLPLDVAAHARLVAVLDTEVTIAEGMGGIRELERRGSGKDVPLDPKVGIQRLLESGLLIDRRDGRLGFRHALVRESVIRSTPEDFRRAVHESAVRFYGERNCPLPEQERLP